MNHFIFHKKPFKHYKIVYIDFLLLCTKVFECDERNARRARNTFESEMYKKYGRYGFEHYSIIEIYEDDVLIK